MLCLCLCAALFGVHSPSAAAETLISKVLATLSYTPVALMDVGYITADTAWYYEQQKLWKLRGRVHIRNVNGLIFDSEELFWDGQKHEFYSHKFSKVVTPERTLQGTYFRSDEHMAHYEVTNSVGSFQSEDISGENNQQNNGQPADTTQVQPYVPQRPAATRRAATQKQKL
jgi:hypothetical protein